MTLYNKLRQLRPAFVVGAAMVLMAHIALLDWVTEREVSFAVFYLIPVMLAAWVCARWQRITIYFLAGVTSLTADLVIQRYSEGWIGYWNAFARLAIFVVAGELTAQLSRRNQDLENEIAERKSAEVKLRDLTETLEQKVIERSAAAEMRSVELARSESALRDQTKILQSVLNSMGDGVVVVKASGEIVLCNPEAKRLLGLSENDASIGRWLQRQQAMLNERVAEDTAQAVRSVSAAARGDIIDGAELLIHHDSGGEGKWLRMAARPLQNEEGLTQGAVIVLGDLTMKKSLERQVAEVSEREQRRLGQDLHDGVCQHFVSTSFACNMVAETLAEKGIAEAKQVAEIGDLIKQGIIQARNLARVLHPVQLAVGGLIPALEELAQSVRKLTNVACEFECGEATAVNDDVTATNLYRIAQEATNNALKHSRAAAVKIELNRHGDWVRLSVTDNGIGFDPRQTSNKGMGLRIMNSRASVIGATFDVHSIPDRGTIVSCSFRSPSS